MTFGIMMRTALVAASVTLASAASAQVGEYGAWTVESTNQNNIALASTTNDTGSSFGVLCSDDCLVVIQFETTCDDGMTVPMLVNTGNDVFAPEFVCIENDDDPIWATEYSEAMVGMFEQDSIVSFANGLTDGEYYISRFLLDGSAEAVAAAMTMTGVAK
ncbi:hypothetical protein [Parasphingopyxis lamellibrachiae]|uniref:Invasion protein IalB n=1 Tax=Parasphingopyxis lamellibrachiae TaxID=680125 RepID=A0A3D9FE65_9SPHN|nr:hypothetical protein [Parasphingopyxis lamellibrachiae]RED15852.1 hypothetical protein DFR46_0860 [Parasphingopyxis lamellibrachiae]